MEKIAVRRNGKPHPGGLTRRQFSKSMGTTGLALATGTGLGLFGGVAPALAQQRKVHMLAWNHFIPAADDETRRQAKEFEKQTGITVVFETINQNDLLPRATAAVESGAGPDIFVFQWNHPHLYGGGLADHSKIFNLDDGDKVYPFQQEAAIVDGVPRGIPYYSIATAMCYREDVFKEVGIEVPTYWEEFLRAGTKLKNFGMPIGQTLGHTVGDAPLWCYMLLWSFGSQEVDEKGKVAIDSRQTRHAIEFMTQLWHDACDESALAWDDSSNNRAYLSEQVSCTLNGSSIYFVSRMKEMDRIANNTNHFLHPTGANGRFHAIVPLTFSVMKYSKNQEAAFEWIRFQLRPDNYERYIVTNKGFVLGRTPKFETHPYWMDDHRVAAFNQAGKYGRNFGWPGPFNRAASEVQAKYILVDMFARAVQGETPQKAIAWAEKEMKAIYEQG